MPHRSLVLCIGGGAGLSTSGATAQGCVAGLPNGPVFFGDYGVGTPGGSGKANGFGGLANAGGFLLVGSTNATKASDLGGYFTTQSASVGVAAVSAGGSWATGHNSAGKEIDIALVGWTPGVSLLPVGYTYLNTDTGVVGGN